MRISVVIPTFNNHHLTRRCLAALFATTAAEVLAEVVVVDDASTDGTSAAWTAAQSGIVPVLLARNRGFSGACNAGAARCTGEAVLFLNNDAFAQPGSLAAMRAVLADDPAVGIVGARLLYADGSLQHAGLVLLPGSAAAWWHVYKHHGGTLGDANVARDYLAVTGAALLIRSELLARLGGFDEGFSNGWEDVDLCLRSWCAGARVRYEPRAVLEHLESATLGRVDVYAPNVRRFSERWSEALSAAPRYVLPEIPPLALAVDEQGPDGSEDAWALAHVRQFWGAHLGAAVTSIRPGARFARARIDLQAALARRLPTLEVAWGDACLKRATGAHRVALVAPRSVADAAAYARAAAIDAWWTPTHAGRDALLAGGIAADRIHVVTLGAGQFPRATPAGRPVVAAACGRAMDALAELRRIRPEVHVVSLPPSGARPDFGTVDVLLAADRADRWGLLLPAALAAGCAAITTGPLEPNANDTSGVMVVEPGDAAQALVALTDSIAACRSARPAVALDATRRFDPVVAAKRVAELARATAGGLPAASGAAVDRATASRLRGTRYGGVLN